jgi:Uri superfamily endonuclease
MQFTTFGNNSRAGSYLLLIELRKAVELAFGRFRGGRPVTLEKGSYLYVGSALGTARGAFPLASRLLRHASRSGGRAPHGIRNDLMGFFATRGYEPDRRSEEKKLHWHIDHLLDLADAELSHIVMVMSPERLEHRLAELVASMDGALPVADRLGAQDAASGTHLFRIENPSTLLNNLAGSFLSGLQEP